MHLGERIYHLRTEKGMSQGDLADALSVSRQSVSKWETGSATPDLEKLLKLSQLFDISLDALVKGEAPAQPEPAPEPQPKIIYVERPEPAVPKRKIAAAALFGLAILTVLLCTILGSMLGGVLFSLPFWACGTVCLLFRQRIGLWCSWVVFAMVDIYLRYATGLSWMNPIALIQHMIRDRNIRWVVSIVLTLLLAILIVCTIRSNRQKVLEPCRRVTLRLVCMGLVIAVLYVIPFGLSKLLVQYAADGKSLFAISRVFQVVGMITGWGKVLLFCHAAIDLLALGRWKRQQKAA